MDILKLNFTILKYCGLWWPEKNNSLNKIFYNILTIATLSLMYVSTLTQFVYTILEDYDFNGMIDNSFMLLTMTSLCFKLTNFVLRRQTIIQLLNIIRNDICRYENEMEEKIQKKFDYIARSDTIFFAIVVEITCIGFMTMPIVGESYKNRTLLFKVWLPYNLSNLTIYWITYAHQSISLIMAANLNVVSDTMVSGLIVQACAQLEILKDRIIHLTRDSEFENIELNVKKCVKHHAMIYKFAKKLEKIFSRTMFFQFFVSVLTLCSCVLKLSHKILSGVEIITLIGYIACILLQVLFYCWHGNEIKLKSLSVSDAVYISEWNNLDPKIAKDLKMIMVRSSKPIEITCGSVFILSLQTYVTLLKTSYSAFNLLQNT